MNQDFFFDRGGWKWGVRKKVWAIWIVSKCWNKIICIYFALSLIRKFSAAYIYNTRALKRRVERDIVCMGQMHHGRVKNRSYGGEPRRQLWGSWQRVPQTYGVALPMCGWWYSIYTLSHLHSKLCKVWLITTGAARLFHKFSRFSLFNLISYF